MMRLCLIITMLSVFAGFHCRVESCETMALVSCNNNFGDDLGQNPSKETKCTALNNLKACLNESSCTLDNLFSLEPQLSEVVEDYTGLCSGAGTYTLSLVLLFASLKFLVY